MKMIMWTVVILFLSLVSLESFVNGQSKTGKRTSSKDEDSCLPLLRDYLIANNIHEEELVPPTKAHDRRMEICYNGRTENQTSCCTHKLEKRFRAAMDRQLHELIYKKNSELRNLISRNIAVYQDEVITMIKTAEQRTARLFTGTYHIGTKSQTAELTRFFGDLTALYDKPDGSIQVFGSVSRFFNQLFPLVFHNILNDPTAVELTDDYRKCLVRARNEIRPAPFGEAPQKVSTELSQAVSLSHLFLTSLRTALEALNATDTIMLDTHCSKALVRMQHCSICQSQQVKPCRNLCLNVMRGCLARLQSMDDPWNKYMDAMALFNAPESAVNVMKQFGAYQQIHTRISESIMHAMETTHKFYSKVTAKCGNPQAYQGSPAPRQAQPTLDATPPPADLLEQGRLLRQFLFTSLTESKGIYGNLADGLCDEKEFAAQRSHDQCWNGRAVGIYEEAVSGKSLQEQADNPELDVNARLEDTLERLIKKKDQLGERIASQMGTGQNPQDDSYGDSKYVVYSSGDGVQKRNQQDKSAKYWDKYIVKQQGSGDGADGDDEDDNVGVSSGSGDGSYAESGDGGTTQYNGGYNNGGTRGDDDIYIENQTPSRNANRNRPPVKSSTGKEDQLRDNGNSASTHRSVLFSTVLLMTIALWLNG